MEVVYELGRVSYLYTSAVYKEDSVASTMLQPPNITPRCYPRYLCSQAEFT